MADFLKLIEVALMLVLLINFKHMFLVIFCYQTKIQTSKNKNCVQLHGKDNKIL